MGARWGRTWEAAQAHVLLAWCQDEFTLPGSDIVIQTPPVVAPDKGFLRSLLVSVNAIAERGA